MNRIIGHVLRLVGLSIEMVGVWAVLTGRGDKDATRITLPGGSTAPVAWLAVVGLGFVLWLTGRTLLFLSRPRRRKPARIDDAIKRPGRIGDEAAKPERIDDEIAWLGRIGDEAAKPERTDDEIGGQ